MPILRNPLILFMFIQIACAEDLPTQLIESDHFRYYFREGDQPCSGLLLQLENHYELNTDFLGAALPLNIKIDYYKFLDDSDVRKSGCDGSYSCVRGTKVFSSEPLDESLLLRAYTYYLGNPPAFFQQGIAVVLTCRFFIPVSAYSVVYPEVRIEKLLVSKEFQSQNLLDDVSEKNLVAASFTRHLLDKFGPDSWRRFFSSAAYDAKLEEISAFFEEAFGTSLEKVIEDWRSTLPKHGWKSVICLKACGGEPLVFPSGSTGRKEGVVSWLPAEIPFNISRQEDIEIYLEGTVNLSLYPCRGSDLQWFVPYGLLRGQTLTWAKLEPGPYFFEIWPENARSESNPYKVVVSTKENVIGETCETSEVQTIPPELTTLYLFASSSGMADDYPNNEVSGAGDRVVRFKVTTHRTVRSASTKLFDSAYLIICAGGCPGETGVDCSDSLMSKWNKYELVPGQTYSLVMDSIPGEWQMYRIWLVFEDM